MSRSVIASVLLLLAGGPGPARAGVLFWPARLDFPVGDGPVSIAVGDLHGVRLADLVPSAHPRGGVAGLLGNGDGAVAAAGRRGG